MTEAEFAAIKERWAWRDRVYSEVPGSDDIVALIRAVEERDAYLHDLMVDASTLTRRAVEEFAAELVDTLVEERKRIAQNPVVSGWSAIYYAIEMIKKIVGDVTPDPLPPDQVRQENERLRQQIDELLSGCGSNSCKVQRPHGQGNNGPCRCVEKLRAARGEE